MASEAINAQANLWVAEPHSAQSSARLQAVEKARPLAQSRARVPAPARRSSREAKKSTFPRKHCFVSGWTVRSSCICGRKQRLTQFCPGLTSQPLWVFKGWGPLVLLVRSSTSINCETRFRALRLLLGITSVAAWAEAPGYSSHFQDREFSQ